MINDFRIFCLYVIVYLILNDLGGRLGLKIMNNYR